MSGTIRKASRSPCRSPSITQANAACRARITPTSRDGAPNRASNSRAPAEVTVRSITDRSEPSRPPESACTSSRLRRVAASICTVPPEASRTGARSKGSLPLCVSSR